MTRPTAQLHNEGAERRLRCVWGSKVSTWKLFRPKTAVLETDAAVSVTPPQYLQAGPVLDWAGRSVSTWKLSRGARLRAHFSGREGFIGFHVETVLQAIGLKTSSLLDLRLTGGQRGSWSSSFHVETDARSADLSAGFCAGRRPMASPSDPFQWATSDTDRQAAPEGRQQLQLGERHAWNPKGARGEFPRGNSGGGVEVSTWKPEGAGTRIFVFRQPRAGGPPPQPRHLLQHPKVSVAPN